MHKIILYLKNNNKRVDQKQISTNTGISQACVSNFMKKNRDFFKRIDIIHTEKGRPINVYEFDIQTWKIKRIEEAKKELTELESI